MPFIYVPQLNKKILCENNDNLMSVLLNNEVPVASSCLGDGICGKCVLEVEFKKKETPIAELESILVKKYNWEDTQRASCQIKVTSDTTVRSTYW